MSTFNPYSYPASFSYFGPTRSEVNDVCNLCGATGAALDGASVVAAAEGGWGFRCRPCTVAENDALALNELIDRLTRNPVLAAKVRKALGFQEPKP